MMNYSLNQRPKTSSLHEKQRSNHPVPFNALRVLKGVLPSSQSPVRDVVPKQSIVSGSYHAQSHLRLKDRIVEAKDDLISENIIPERGLPRLNDRLSSPPGANVSKVQSVEELALTKSAQRRPLPSVYVSEGQRLCITPPRSLGPLIKLSANESSTYFNVEPRAPYCNPIHRSSPRSRPWSSDAEDIAAANPQSVTILDDDDAVDSSDLWKLPSGEFSVHRRYRETLHTKDLAVVRQGVSTLNPKLSATAHGECLSSMAESCDKNIQSVSKVSSKDVELSKTGSFQTTALKAPSATEKSALDNLLSAELSSTVHSRPLNQPLHGSLASVGFSREIGSTVRGQPSYLAQNISMPSGQSEFGRPKYGMPVRNSQGCSIVLPPSSNEGIAVGLPLRKVSWAQREMATDIASSVSSSHISIVEKRSEVGGASSQTSCIQQNDGFHSSCHSGKTAQVIPCTATDSVGVTWAVSALASDTVFEVSAGFDSERYSYRKGSSTYNSVPSIAISSSNKARSDYVMKLPVTNLTEQDPAKPVTGTFSDIKTTVGCLPIFSGAAPQSVSVDAEHVMFKAFVTQACNSFSQPLSELMSKVLSFEEICKNMKDEISAVQLRVRDFEADFEKYFRCVSNAWMQPKAEVPERDRLDCAAHKPSTRPATVVSEPSTALFKEPETTGVSVEVPGRCESHDELSQAKQFREAGEKKYQDDDVLFVDDVDKNSRCGGRSSDTETVCYGICSGSSTGASSPVSTGSLDAPQAEELLIMDFQTTDLVNSSGLQSTVNPGEVLKRSSDVRAGSAQQPGSHKQTPSKVIYVGDDHVGEANSDRLRPESRKRHYRPSSADRCETGVELELSRDVPVRRAYRGKSAYRSSLERVAVNARLQRNTIDLVDEDDGATKRKYSN